MAGVGLAHFGDCRVSATVRNCVSRTIIPRVDLLLGEWPQFDVGDDAKRLLAMTKRWGATSSDYGQWRKLH